MPDRPRSVQAQMVLRLHVPGSCLDVPATLRYDVDDPYAVRVRFRADASSVIEWMLARDLLSQGLAFMSGDGDVRVWPGPDRAARVAYLELTSPSGQALFETPARELRHFLSRTYEVVPAGREGEFARLDDELDMLLYGDLT